MRAAETTPQKDYGLRHLAVIMDGNRRWAQSKNLPSFEGHKAGVKALRNLVKLCPQYGIEHLTAYTFSTENWNRKEAEVNFLLNLLGEVALSELKNLNEANVRVQFIGDLKRFRESKLYSILTQLENATANNSKLCLYIALNYGSIDELEQARQTIIKEDLLETINEETFNNYLYTKNVPFPEVVLRTGGERRLSNYLLWQAANSELQFIDTLWPDFSEAELLKALTSFSNK